MKIIQTFYNYQEKDPINNAAGYLSPAFNWMSTAMSCLLLKKHFKHVTLYCNKSAEEVIISKLDIPFDDVVITSDFMDEYAGCNLWALPKTYTYTKQTSPFLHVDCDWYMFDKLSKKKLESALIAQNIEYDDHFSYKNMIDILKDKKAVFPEFTVKQINNNNIYRAICAGILGGNDLEFFNTYTDSIFNFVKENHELLKELSNRRVNDVYDQFFFYELAKSQNKKITYCTPGNKLSCTYNWMKLNLSYTKPHGYMHLLASLKKRKETYEFVYHYLKYLSPSLHAKIASEFNLTNHTSIYLNNPPDKNDTPLIPIETHFKRTLEILSANNLKIEFPGNNIAGFESALKEILSKINSEETANVIKNIVEFEKNKLNLKCYLENNYSKLSVYQEQKLCRLWDTDLKSSRSYDLKISLNKDVIIKELTGTDVILYLNFTNEEIIDKLKKQNKIIISFVPNLSLSDVNELIIYGIDLKIFNIVREEGSISVGKLVERIIDGYAIDHTTDINKIKNSLLMRIYLSIQNNLYNCD